MFKAAIAALAIALGLAGFYAWRAGDLARDLKAVKIERDNARADAALLGVAVDVLQDQADRLARITQEQDRVEARIRATEGADNEARQSTVDFVDSLGLFRP